MNELTVLSAVSECQPSKCKLSMHFFTHFAGQCIGMEGLYYYLFYFVIVYFTQMFQCGASVALFVQSTMLRSILHIDGFLLHISGS